ncbi:site-specific integrase [Deinococcus soli (ex Cha et al. 2016)]|uniref:Integrase/recombinase XerC n=2 Tax=Deinococcus soli (ex Cha et al. 2016) TaxID=1309411 RepID=A0ACC6KMH6_9DEIO|nr:site-specific integrase [Deinococcus soli (ex Cha et al. 2016)]MDR6221184.1 integrase/recombinase XerC [Deinococcus soli (ex Cha et al. 2016)]MDR6331117.1 integrase/recombinase XerC [Deinococcus soli (ex Cha et al. 2016)]MDR6753725.1 integrase/recombinase XerC [Deinococcus soli (ex Cha et al. 2016)]
MTLALDVLRTTTFDRAKAWGDLNPEERKRRAVLAVRDQDADTLWSLTEAYLTLHGSSGTAISPRTLKAYRWAVNRYLTYAGAQAVNLLRASSSDGVRFVRTVEAEGLSASSTRVQLAGVRLFYAALRWADATQAAPFNDVKPVREKTAAWDKRSPYTHEEVQVLLEHADERMQALILLCAHGGLRISEALAIRHADINLDGRELTVRHGKGGKQRRVVIGDTLIRALNRLPEQPGSLIGGSYPAAVERLRRLCLRAGVAYRGYHALRHYAGTRLTREGASLDDVARHLGHSVLETARIYAKWSDDSLRRRVGQW